MDWLIDNFGKLLPIILMVVYFWVNARKKASEEEEAGDGEGDPDQAERARTIQEEIRRRILERQGGATPTPRVQPPVLVEEGLHQTQTATERSAETWSAQPTGEVYERAKPQVDYAKVLERQMQLAERLEQARRQTSRDLEAKDRIRAHSALKAAHRAQAPEAIRTSRNPLRKGLLGDLSDRKGLRRAIILREVLGKPVGMRSG